MTKIRQQSRFKILSQKRSHPVTRMQGSKEYDFRHLEEYEEKDTLIPYLEGIFKELEGAKIEDLIANIGQVKKMIINSKNILERHKGVVILRTILQAGNKDFI